MALQTARPRLCRPAHQLTKTEGDPPDKSIHTYTNLVGSLLYLSVCARNDIAQAGRGSTLQVHARAQHYALTSCQGDAQIRILFKGAGLRPKRQGIAQHSA